MPSEKIWDFWAGKYDSLWVQKYSLEPTRQLILNEIKCRIKKEGGQKIRLLDIGCGTGQLIQDIQKEFPGRQITCRGLDKAPEMIRQACGKAIPNSVFSVGDAQNLKPLGEQYDLITCCHSFPYYPDKKETLQEFRMVLKPRGVLYLVQAAANTWYDRLILSLVKLTTSPGDYPADEQVIKLAAEAGMVVCRQKRLAGFSFVPSITLSIMKKERADEGTINTA
ncbi:MAG: class I SAM-dependent methyltransferase [Peptococcaceae bacterium]